VFRGQRENEGKGLGTVSSTVVRKGQRGANNERAGKEEQAAPVSKKEREKRITEGSKISGFPL